MLASRASIAKLLLAAVAPFALVLLPDEDTSVRRAEIVPVSVAAAPPLVREAAPKVQSRSIATIDYATHIAIDDEHVYAANYNRIWRAPRAGGPAELIASPENITALAMTPNYVWWIAEYGVQRVKKGTRRIESITRIPYALYETSRSRDHLVASGDDVWFASSRFERAAGRLVQTLYVIRDESSRARRVATVASTHEPEQSWDYDEVQALIADGTTVYVERALTGLARVDRGRLVPLFEVGHRSWNGIAIAGGRVATAARKLVVRADDGGSRIELDAGLMTHTDLTHRRRWKCRRPDELREGRVVERLAAGDGRLAVTISHARSLVPTCGSGIAHVETVPGKTTVSLIEGDTLVTIGHHEDSISALAVDARGVVFAAGRQLRAIDR